MVLSFSDPAHQNHWWKPVKISCSVDPTTQTLLEETESKKENHTADKIHREGFCPAHLKAQVRAGTTMPRKIWFYLLVKTASKDSHLCMKLCSHLDETKALHFLIYNHHCSDIRSFLQYSRILHCDHTAQTPHIHLYLKIQIKMYALCNIFYLVHTGPKLKTNTAFHEWVLHSFWWLFWETKRLIAAPCSNIWKEETCNFVASCLANCFWFTWQIVSNVISCYNNPRKILYLHIS